MKKLLLLGTALVMLTACSQPEAEKKTASEQQSADTTTTNEVKNKLDAYMKENKQLLNNININDSSPTQQQLKALKTAKAALIDNNQQLNEYINSHDIPSAYEKGTAQTLHYFEHAADLLDDVEQPLAELSKGKVSALSKLTGLPERYSDTLGHERQQEVKQFLKDKGIDTSLFDNSLFDLVK